MSNLRIAVLISGGGTTLKNLIKHMREHGLPVEIRLVISSRASAGGLKYADEIHCPTKTIAKRDFADPKDHCEAVFSACRQAEVDIVVMGGYLEHLLIPEDFTNRVINIHPSLIPAFCGKGFYGLRVHQSALDFGVKVSGCTVHFVDDEFDHGPIIAQQACQVLAGDTADSLQTRVFEQECEIYPRVLREMAEGKIEFGDNKHSRNNDS